MATNISIIHLYFLVYLLCSISPAFFISFSTSLMFASSMPYFLQRTPTQIPAPISDLKPIFSVSFPIYRLMIHETKIMCGGSDLSRNQQGQLTASSTLIANKSLAKFGVDFLTRIKGMRRVKGEAAIVQDDAGIGARKRVNDDKDAYPAKRAKEAVDCRNLGYKVEGERAGNGIWEKEEEFNNMLERLRGLLKDDPDKLRKKDVEDVIRYLDVRDIISSALSSSRVKEKGTREDRWYIDLVKPRFVPSPEKVSKLVGILLLCGIEELKAVDLFILFNNFSKAGFASMLLPALVSYNKRRPDGDESLYSREMRANIYDLCCVLPWELFAHVMYKLTSLSLFEYSTSTISTSKEDEEEEIHKKAADDCDICYGKGKHSGVYGYHCSYWHTVPYGATIGSGHNLHCRDCCRLFVRVLTFKGCSCGSLVGRAVPKSLQWKSG